MHHGHSLSNNTHHIHGHSWSSPHHSIHVHRHHNNGFFSPGEALCCGALLGLACFSPRFAFACILAIVTITIISCLASLAMSVTGEALLSVLLVGAVIGGIAYLCNSQGCGATQQQNTYSDDFEALRI